MATVATDTLTVLTAAESPIHGREAIDNGVVRFLEERQVEEAVSARKLFVFTSATRLDRLADVISASNKHNRLQALLVESDVDPKWVPFMLKRAGLRTLRNMLVHHGSALPQRVLNAWVGGQQHDSIAAATVVGECLFVVSCGFDSFEIGFDAYPALARIPVAERPDFEIEEDGVFLHWPDADVHLDLHDIRVALNPELRAKARAQKLAHDQAFGAAVRILRQKLGISQTSIPGLSSRHVRRIENGYVPGVEAIDALARAHGLDPDAYLELVTETME
ncbi:MAG TPA: DUF2442 domain-containing protein [Longimicrobium sp.]|nr:DUF2442 domain-containing protein [Longimicrobium sp.]